MTSHPILDLHELFCQEALVLGNRSPATARWWRTAIRMLMGHFGEGEIKGIGDLTAERVRGYLYGKRLGGWTAVTFSSQLRALRAFFKWCVRKGHLDADPLVGIERPRIEKKLPKRISREDAERVLEHAFHGGYPRRFLRHRNRAVLGTMLHAGLRAKETLGLKMGDVDLERSVISVVCGKGAKDRLVPMSPALRRYLSDYAEERALAGKGGIHFFNTLKGDGPLTYTGLTRLVSRIRTETGVDFTPHRLRHTFATMMVEGGCGIYSLQKLLGHSDIQTTTIYLSASTQMLQADIAKHPLG